MRAAHQLDQDSQRPDLPLFAKPLAGGFWDRFIMGVRDHAHDDERKLGGQCHVPDGVTFHINGVGTAFFKQGRFRLRRRDQIVASDDRRRQRIKASRSREIDKPFAPDRVGFNPFT